MSLWFLLWLFLSLTLLYFFGWTLYIIQRQKKAWSAFAKKYGLRYFAGGFSEAPQMEGVIDEYAFSFFPAQYELGDVRHSRKMTAIEMTLKSDVPFDGFIASGMLIDASKGAGLPHETKPLHGGWNDENIILTDKIGSMQAYLTEERMEIINRWLKLKNSWFLLGFRNDVFLLRIDTPSPLDNPKKINALVKKLLQDVPALELKQGEASMLQIAAAKTVSVAREKLPGDIENAAPLTLELEDDDAANAEQGNTQSPQSDGTPSSNKE